VNWTALPINEKNHGVEVLDSLSSLLAYI